MPSLTDNSFDKIVTIETIEHLYKDQRTKYLKELNRLLKKNGKVIMSTPYNGLNKALHPLPKIRHPYDHKIEFTFQELKKELSTYFKIKSFGGIHHKNDKKEKVIITSLPKDTQLRYLKTQLRKTLPESFKNLVASYLGCPHDIKKYIYRPNKLTGGRTMFLVLEKI